MTKWTRLVTASAIVSISACPLAANAAADAATDPAPTLTDICTDRPTKSNGACTVDAGHFQYETDLFNGTFQRVGGVTTDTYDVTNPTLKYGLTKTIDLEVNIAPYEVVRTHDKFGATSTAGGIGDLYLRLKYNFLNSADGKWSASIIPYLKAPTARSSIGNGAFEGGALAPITYKFSEKVSMTTQPEVDVYKDNSGSGSHINTQQLVSLAYSLPQSVTLYAEIWGDWNFDPTGTVRQYSADAAIGWAMTKKLQVDAGLNFGLNRETPGVQAYVGLSQKF